MSPDRHEILVIGAGPAGLLAACELARYGVVPRIVDDVDEETTVVGEQATAINPVGACVAVQSVAEVQPEGHASPGATRDSVDAVRTATTPS